MTIFGWDASDFDWDRGPMDLAAARRDGIDFFTHKATEGTSVKHWRYGEALTRARAAGIPFLGAYIVIRSGAIGPQVDYFLSYLDSQTPWWRGMPEFFLQVDLEHWPYDQVDSSQGVRCAELLRERSGHWVVLYAPQWAYGNTIGGGDPLWASAYGGNPAAHFRDAYPGDGDGKRWQSYSGRSPVFLQYGSRATIGSQPSCDANAFRGSLADLRRLITGSANPSPGPFPGPTMGDSMYVVNAPGDFTLWLSDGFRRKPIVSIPQASAYLTDGAAVRLVDVPLEWFGEPVGGEPVQFTPEELAQIAAAARAGAEAGAPSHEELTAAAFEGAQRAEAE